MTLNTRRKNKKTTKTLRRKLIERKAVSRAHPVPESGKGDCPSGRFLLCSTKAEVQSVQSRLTLNGRRDGSVPVSAPVSAVAGAVKTLVWQAFGWNCTERTAVLGNNGDETMQQMQSSLSLSRARTRIVPASAPVGAVTGAVRSLEWQGFVPNCTDRTSACGHNGNETV